MQNSLLLLTVIIYCCGGTCTANAKIHKDSRRRSTSTYEYKYNGGSSIGEQHTTSRIESIYYQHEIPLRLSKDTVSQRQRKRRVKKEEQKQEDTDDFTPPTNDDNDEPILTGQSTSPPVARPSSTPPNNQTQSINERNKMPTSRTDGCTQILNGNYDTILSTTGQAPDSLEIKYQYELQTFFDSVQPKSISSAVQRYLVELYIVPECKQDTGTSNRELDRRLQQAITIGGVATGQNTVLDDNCQETKAIDKFRCYRIESSNLIYTADNDTTVNSTDNRLSIMNAIMTSFNKGIIMQYYNESKDVNPQHPKINSLLFLTAQSDDVSIKGPLSASAHQARSGMSRPGKFFLTLFFLVLFGVAALLLLKKYKPNIYKAILKGTQVGCSRIASITKAGVEQSMKTAATLKEKYNVYQAEREKQLNHNKGIVVLEHEDELNHKEHTSSRNKSVNASITSSSAISGVKSSTKSTSCCQKGDEKYGGNISRLSVNVSRSLRDEERSQSFCVSTNNDMGMETILKDLEESAIEEDSSILLYSNSCTDNKLFANNVFANASYETMTSTPSPESSIKRSAVTTPDSVSNRNSGNQGGIMGSVRPTIDQLPKSIRLFAESVFLKIKSTTQAQDINHGETVKERVFEPVPNSTPRNMSSPTITNRYTPETLPSPEEFPSPSDIDLEESSNTSESRVLFNDPIQLLHSMDSTLLNDCSQSMMCLEQMDDIPVHRYRKPTVPDTIDL